MSTQPHDEFGSLKTEEERAAYEKIKQEWIEEGPEKWLRIDLEDGIPMEKLIAELDEIERLEKLKRAS